MSGAGVPVLTVDGPGGSGKGTVCKRVAACLGWHLLDSGALYRVLGEAAFRHRINLDDEPALARLAEKLDVRFEAREGEEVVRVILEGDDVSGDIRTEAAGERASKVAALALVREALLARQRDFARLPGLVADGRDMGTVVFPDAQVKIYLTASAEERARRRYNQLMGKGGGASLQEVLKEIEARDARDMNRAVAPLRPAEDALVLDTTRMTIDEVVSAVMDTLRQKLGERL